MAAIDRLLFVGFYVSDQRATREFFTKKIGLQVRAEQPKFGYLELAATARGPDAAIQPWQPSPQMGEGYEAARQRIGEITGIGFSTNDLGKSVEAWRRRGVTVEVEEQEDMGPFARFQDPDGNTFFATGPAKPRTRRAGIAAFSWVTVVSRDTKRGTGFYTNALGMKGGDVGGYTTYRLTAKGTGIMPFTPSAEMYADPSMVEKDLAHVGEDTAITFSTKDIRAAQDFLLSRGVRFQWKAAQRPWGGWTASFYDADDNVYWLLQPAPTRKPAPRKAAPKKKR
jgi:catechol 2,3-dioxygenase-like lactoylglutathione lyase family enzyme